MTVILWQHSINHPTGNLSLNYPHHLKTSKMWAAYAKTAKEIPLPERTVPKGHEVTITKGRNEKYALWHSTGIFDLHESYIDEETIKQFAKQIMEQRLQEKD
jgi:hypothetical protein